DILSGPHQKVILPDLNAGCTMADMAEGSQVEEAWDEITAMVGEDVLPITYMNSSAAIKGFVGRFGGAVSTSSNARAILHWAWPCGRSRRLLFWPAKPLGGTPGYRRGTPWERRPAWDPTKRAAV